MEKIILYIHGKGGDSSEAERYRNICPGFEVFGVDYKEYLPWLVKGRIRTDYERAKDKYGRVYLIANSIGAYFAMDALGGCGIERALFISPVLDMERLILDMMTWANVPEKELMEKKEIPTDTGETLSWEYLCYVRENPIVWDIPTSILYAENDEMISRETVDSFTRVHNADITVMENGEHWFHTDKQLAFLENWVKRILCQPSGQN